MHLPVSKVFLRAHCTPHCDLPSFQLMAFWKSPFFLTCQTCVIFGILIGSMEEMGTMMFFKNTLFAKLSVTCRQITGSSLELAAFFMLE